MPTWHISIVNYRRGKTHVADGLVRTRNTYRGAVECRPSMLELKAVDDLFRRSCRDRFTKYSKSAWWNGGIQHQYRTDSTQGRICMYDISHHNNHCAIEFHLPEAGSALSRRFYKCFSSECKSKPRVYLGHVVTIDGTVQSLSVACRG